MSETQESGWKPEHSVLFAQICCLGLGLSLLIWGVAPAVIQRVVSGQTPPIETLSLNSSVFLLGVLFIGLHRLIRQLVSWAAWAAYLLSMTICALAVVLTWTAAVQATGLFLLLMSGGTAFACWMAIGAVAKCRLETVENTSGDPPPDAETSPRS